MNHKLPSQEGRALAHAGETEPFPLTALHIETNTGVRNLQYQAGPITRQSNLRLPGTAVPDDVVQRFLRDPVEAQRHVRVNGLRKRIALEGDINHALTRDVATQQLKRLDEAEGLQLRRMKLVRQIVNVRGDFADAIGKSR